MKRGWEIVQFATLATLADKLPESHDIISWLDLESNPFDDISSESFRLSRELSQPQEQEDCSG